jgi:hypothetical protein
MAFIDDIPVEYLWCKDMMHAWDPDSMVSREVFNRRIERWEIKRTVRCMNCGSHKTQVLTKGFQLLRTDYEYPDDYRVPGASPYRMTVEDRAQIRARSTALRGGAEKPSAADRMAARTAQPAKKTTRRKRA